MQKQIAGTRSRTDYDPKLTEAFLTKIGEQLVWLETWGGLTTGARFRLEASRAAARRDYDQLSALTDQLSGLRQAAQYERDKTWATLGGVVLSGAGVVAAVGLFAIAIFAVPPDARQQRVEDRLSRQIEHGQAISVPEAERAALGR